MRHTVTGMLEQKDGIQLTAELIPLQKIKEFQKVLFNQNKISVVYYVIFKMLIYDWQKL